MKLKKLAAVLIAAAAVTLLCAAGTITIYSEDTDPNSHDHSGWTEWTSDDSLPDTAGEYYLTKDVTITRNDNYIEMPDGDLKLCLNGHNITVDHIIEVGNVRKNRESNVAIYDCQGECGTIMIDNDGLITETLFDVFYGSLTVYNGKLEAKNGKAIHSSNDSAVTVEGGTIAGMECGISINGGTVIINDGTVEGSKECDYSSGIDCSSEDAQLIVNGGNISGAWQGIYVTAGTATINSGTIEGTDDYSDGIWCYGELGSAEVIVKGGTISGDSSGIYILGGAVKVEKGEISGTEGGIWCTQDSDVTALEIIGGTISSTEYSIYSDDPDGTFMLSGNPTLTGDIYLKDDAKITVADQLTNTDPYTIEMSQAGVFTDGDTTHNDPDKFKAAEIHSNNGYSVIKNADGQLQLALKTYTVTYNGGEYSEGTIAPTAKTHGTSVTLSSERFTRTGYIQTGWATEDSGEKVYDLGGTYSDNADITLYPAWEECDHSFGDWTDCEDGENHTRTCDVCGANETVNHSFGNWTDCEDGENHTLTCVCGASETEKHTFDDWTDNEDGETHTHACVCGASETEKHTFGDWTDNEDGDSHARACVCGASEIEKHTFGDWTYNEDGETHTHACVCGASETKKHIFGDWTDNEDGDSHARACVCGASETEKHAFGDWTDIEDGETHTRACADCKAQETASHVESEEGETTKPATETENGEMVYKCRDCGYVMRRETIPAAGSGTPETPVPGTPAPQPPAPGTSSPEVSAPETSAPETTAPEVSAPEITAPSTAEPAPDQDPNAGSVIINYNSGDNAPAVSIDAETADRLKKEVIAEHLTDEERAAVASGADLEIILSVEDAGDTVSAQDKQAAEAVIADTAYTMGQYLNIDLLKLINGQQVGKITQLNAPISVTIEIPQELTAANRTFAIVRVHDGAAEILVDQDTDPNTITIITDRFSTYAIVYQDNTNAADKNQATGVVLVIAPFIAAAAGVIISKKRK